MYAKKPWATPWKKCIVHFNWWCLQGKFSSMDYVLFCFIICWFVLETWYFWNLTLALLKFTEMFRFLAISILMSMFILLYWQGNWKSSPKNKLEKYISFRINAILFWLWFDFHYKLEIWNYPTKISLSSLQLEMSKLSKERKLNSTDPFHSAIILNQQFISILVSWVFLTFTHVVKLAQRHLLN